MAWNDDVAKCFRLLADAFDGRASAIIVETRPSLTLMGVQAIVRVAGPLSRVLARQVAPEDAKRLADTVLDEVALIAPQTATLVADIELAGSVLLWIVGAFKSGTIHVEPGMPPGWRPGGGFGKRRGEV